MIVHTMGHHHSSNVNRVYLVVYMYIVRVVIHTEMF